MPTMQADWSQQALFIDFREHYNDLFMAAQNAHDVTLFAEILDANTKTVNLNWMETPPVFSEWLDERKLQAIGPSYQYSVTARHWEVTIEIDRDELDDNKLQLERKKISQLGLEAGRAPWKMFIDALVANGAGYDGLAYFATTHTQNNQPVQANLLTGTGVTTAALALDLGTAKAALRSFQDGWGRPMNLGDIQLHVLAPPPLEQAFSQVLNGDFLVTSAASGVFGMQSNWLKGFADLTIDPYLVDVNDWYLFATGLPNQPFLYLNRKSPEFVAQDAPNDEANFMRRMLRYGADWRSSIGYGPWWLALKVTN